MKDSNTSLFASGRERRLWVWTAAVVVAIYSTLGLTQTLAGILRARELLDTTFFVMFLVLVAAVVVIALAARPGTVELGVLAGVVAVYVMVLLRMATPEERTHLVEYGILGVLIFEALQERSRHGRAVRAPALLAVVFAGTLGVFDETIQVFIPGRVFDPIDVGFNVLAASMAVTASIVLAEVQRWKSERRARKVGRNV